MANWGILGLGSIAGKFADALPHVPDAKLLAVGSRSIEKAEAFGARFNASRRYGSYEQLAADPNVDVIYVATPHPMHAADSILCLNHGKAVLCEKPFTVNATEAESVIAVARERKLFLLEGMWSRFFPAMAKVRELLTSGAIGEPRFLQADFGFRAGFDPKSRLFDPALGGGALLDVGCYVVSLAHMVFGNPVEVSGVADIGETGVDEQCSLSLKFAKGETASLFSGVRTNTPHEVLIAGTDGTIKIVSPWWTPKDLIVRTGNNAPETIVVPYVGNGFNYEATDVQNCLKTGKLESDVLPLAETVEIMNSLDTLRAQWGLKYPTEV